MIARIILERQSGKTQPADVGHNLGAMGLEALDQYLRDSDVRPLSHFAVEDRATLEQALAVAQPADQFALQHRLDELRRHPEWHDPHDGLKTVQALLERLPHDDRHEGVLSELKIFAQILEDAAQSGDPFRLNAAATL